MTSIEWLIEEMISKGFFKESVTLTNIDHLQYKAEEMYNKEVGISDKEIEQQALTFAKEESYGELSADLWKGYVYGAKRTRDNSKSLSDKWKEYQDWLNEPPEISDEEIEKAARDYDNSVIYGPPLLHFEQGAFWYREQLKNKKD